MTSLRLAVKGLAACVMIQTMEKPELHGLWARLGRSRLAARVAEDLGGEKARAEILRVVGYGGQPLGLAARLAADLHAHLPLCTGPAEQRAFGTLFPGPQLLEAARCEAEAALPQGPAQAQLAAMPASQVRLDLEEEAAWRPWTSGQRILRLARAYFISGDGELAETAWSQLEQFCQASPPLMGPGWTSAGLVAVRALNWLWALRFLALAKGLAGLGAGGGPVVEAVLHLRLMGMLLAQDQEAAGTAPGPEQAAGAAALMYLGRCLPCLPESPQWWEAGRQSLGPALMAWSGAGASGDWAPALAAAEWGALGLWLGLEAGAEMPGVVAGVSRLAALSRALAPPWGSGSLWGWPGEASVLGFDLEPSAAAAASANLAAILLAAPEIRAGREINERLYWTLGPQAGERLRQLAGGPAPGAQEWHGAGVASLCADGVGRKVGLHLSTSPGQAAALGLALFLEGQPLLAPPGPVGRGPLSSHLRSRSAHNTIMMDGQDPKPLGRVDLEALEQGPRHLFLAAAYDGYDHLKDPVLIRRRVFLDHEAGLISLVDQVQSTGKHLCEVFFHLPPETKVEAAGQGSFLLSGVFGQVLFKPEPKAKVTLVTGRGNPPLGWMALGLGRVTPAPVLLLRAAVVGNARITNVIALTSGREA